AIPLFTVKMKIKFQGHEHLSPLENYMPDIGDIEVQHLDFDDFYGRLACDNPTLMAQTINDSGITYTSIFPLFVQCFDIVLSCGANFNLDTKEVVNVH
ncbi:hypothetical protein KI387_034928, partial [Taxus chinensis]